MPFIKPITAILWDGVMHLPEGGPVEVSDEAAEIYISHGSAELVVDVDEVLAPVEVVEAAPVVETVEAPPVADPIVEESLADYVDEELLADLESVGIFTLADLRVAEVEDLTPIKGIGVKRAEKILSAVKD